MFGSPAADAASQPVGSGPLKMLVLFSLSCDLSELLWRMGLGLCIGIYPSFSNKFQTGAAGCHSPETALSPHPSNIPTPLGFSLTSSLLLGPAVLCKTISAGKPDLQKLIK